MQLAAIELACRRSGRAVFAGVNFSIESGAALLVTGRNGAGKSSLLRMVGGLLRPADGAITLDGGDSELTIAEQSHYLGHLDAIKPSLSVGENLQFWADFLGPSGGDVDAALTAVDLASLKALPAAYLSAGQKRRLSIARLIAVPRPIWLLDEPANALDAAAQDRLAGFMKVHLGGGGIILAATHGALGLSGAKELRLDQTIRPPDVGPSP
jgi:heme exporter protein A